MGSINPYTNGIVTAPSTNNEIAKAQDDLNTSIEHGKRQSKISLRREYSLADIKKFKPTRQVGKSHLKTLHMNLSKYINFKFLLVRKEAVKRTVKTYLFLIFENGTKLQWMRELVHAIFPFIEIDGQCKNTECTCKASNENKHHVIKRRGFGYIHEENTQDIIDNLMKQGYIITVEYLPRLKKRERKQKPQLEHFSCKLCEFVGRSQLGYKSHLQKHDREKRILSEVCC